nr:MAG TPA: hypothetical protein [Caudoviricetes sp.]
MDQPCDPFWLYHTNSHHRSNRCARSLGCILNIIEDDQGWLAAADLRLSQLTIDDLAVLIFLECVNDFVCRDSQIGPFDANTITVQFEIREISEQIGVGDTHAVDVDEQAFYSLDKLFHCCLRSDLLNRDDRSFPDHGSGFDALTIKLYFLKSFSNVLGIDYDFSNAFTGLFLIYVLTSAGRVRPDVYDPFILRHAC